ncbi:hypothetical protein BHM03_00028725 [Ensete ventricosum]|nr:hypothetical protein BHM03_00028725 [Ensete ventricosum]
MLLGKRPRPQVRRTPSFAEFSSAVVFDVEAAQTSNQDAIAGHFHPRETRWGAAEAAKIGAAGGEGCWATRHVGSMLFPHSGVHCGNSGDGMAPFLRACGICNRRLGPGRDTYMYRWQEARENERRKRTTQISTFYICVGVNIVVERCKCKAAPPFTTSLSVST